MSDATTENGFSFSLTVNTIDSVKPRQSGSSIIDDKEVTWKHAVKFKTRNIELVPDDDFGEKEKEITLEIEIPCDTMAETVKLNNLMKQIKKSKEPFLIETSLPSLNNGVYASKSLLHGKAFLETYSK